ncbi:hypothetical protein [Bremerella sp.]|uniref:hypothetical protein n=1 Tax=Bremerella sp. TaxID=2795602 RepID=UPI00391C5709
MKRRIVAIDAREQYDFAMPTNRQEPDLNPYESTLHVEAETLPTWKRPGLWTSVLIIWTLCLTCYVPAMVVPPGGFKDPFTGAFPKSISLLITILVVWAAVRNARGLWWISVLLILAWLLLIQFAVVTLGIRWDTVFK